MGRWRCLGTKWRPTEVRRAEGSLPGGTPRRPDGTSRWRDAPLAARFSRAGGSALVTRPHGACGPAALLDAGPVVATGKCACDECGPDSPAHTRRGPAQTRTSGTRRPSIPPPGTAAAVAAKSTWEIGRSATSFSSPAPSAGIQTLRQEGATLRWLRKPFAVFRSPSRPSSGRISSAVLSL